MNGDCHYYAYRHLIIKGIHQSHDLQYEAARGQDPEVGIASGPMGVRSTTVGDTWR